MPVSFLVSTGQTITFGALAAKTYGDPTFNLSATASSGLTVSFALTSAGGICSLSGTTVTILAAGSCDFTASQAGNATYSAATPVVQTLTINKKALTTAVTASNKVYNASTAATVSAGALVGVVGTDDVSVVSGQVTGAFNTADVGTGKPVTVTLGASVLTGTKAGNYTLSVSNSPTANITAKPITMTVGVANKEYDGTNDATISTTSLTGVEAADSGSVSIDGTKVTGVFANPDKANSKSVTVTLASGVLTGTKAGNYSVTVSGTPTANITARAITVTADNQTKLTSAPDPTFTYTINSGTLVSRLGVPDTFSGSLTRASLGTNTAGTYAITTGTLALSSNYSLTVNSGTLTITDKTIPVICWSTPANITYGTALSTTQLNAVAKTICSGGTTIAGTYTYSPVSGTILSPGTYSLTVSFTPSAPDNATYASSSGSVTLVVEPRAITVTATPQSKVYGSADPSLTYSVTTGSLVGSDSLSGSLTRVAGEDVGPYAISAGTLTTANNPKYVITYAGNNLSITAKPITMNVAISNKVYNASTSATIASTSLTGVESSDSIGIDGTKVSGVFGTADVGSGKSVTVTLAAGVLTGTKAGNYTVTVASPPTANITAKPITMSVVASNKEYDGNTSAIIASNSLTGVETADLASVAVDATKVTGVFSNSTVGAGKTVTVTIASGSLTGVKSGNYSVSLSGTPTANITAKPLTMTVTIPNKVYDGKVDATIGSTSLTGIVGSDDVTVDGSKVSGVFGNPDVGSTKTVTISLGTGVLIGAKA